MVDVRIKAPADLVRQIDEYGDATSRNRSSAVRELVIRGLADVERERAILLSVLDGVHLGSSRADDRGPIPSMSRRGPDVQIEEGE